MGKPIFPVPPSSTADVQFRLNRRLKIRAKNYSKPSDTDVACFLGEGAVYLPSSMQAEVEVSEIEWESAVGDKKSEKDREEEEGRWLQRVTFSSRLILNVPPSFTTETIDCQVRVLISHPTNVHGGADTRAVLSMVEGAVCGTGKRHCRPAPDCHHLRRHPIRFSRPAFLRTWS